MSQLKREDWLEHGLMALAAHGVDALTIDGLCKQLQVTKGSFYHHFKNRKVYLTNILEYWEAKYTSDFITASQAEGTVREQLLRLNDLVLASFGTYEVHIRAWAQADPLARAFQERVDQRRIAYLQQLYQVWLDDAAQAQAMAHLIYTVLVGSTAVMPPLKQQEYENMMMLVRQLTTSLITKDEP